MWLGAFYALLLYGRYWIPAIIDSFELIGQRASGSGPLSPSDVFSRGLDLAGALMATSSAAAFFTNLGTSLTMVVTGLITALAFIAITVQFVVAMVESYIIVAAGFVFVGFGGSRWTAPYVERYIALGVANGVKIMLLYLLVGTGMSLSVDWMTEAQKIAGNASPAMSALEIMGASIIFMMLCWQIPKLFAAVLGGSPALAGGDLVGAGAFLTGGAIAVGSAGFAATGAVTGFAGSTIGGAGALPAMLPSVGRTGGDGGSVPPPDTPPSPGSPPTAGPQGTIASENAAASFGSGTPAPRSASLTNAARRLRGIRRGAIVQLPSDASPAAAPPRMNIDHHD
jgi:type IV secretion system protein TrbL